MAWSKRVRKQVDNGTLATAMVAVRNLLSALQDVEEQLLRDARRLQGIATRAKA
jgi:hypothetical protein